MGLPQVLWGRDAMLVVAGVNEPSDELMSEVDRQYRLFVAKAL